ncbi:MAG: glycosyltransferase family 2 protein [Acidimicrobiales bacterium]
MDITSSTSTDPGGSALGGPLDSAQGTPDDPPLGAPTFSVIVPTHRRADLLAEAIASVVAQTRGDWECLVVDDGGGELPDEHDPAALGDPRVRVLRRDHAGGPAAARNTGIDAARGRIVTFLDDDDRYRADRLEIAALGLTDPAVGVTICWTAWFAPGDPIGPLPQPLGEAVDQSLSADHTAAGSSVRERGRDETGWSGRMLDGDVSDVVLDATTPHLGGTAVRADQIQRFDERYHAVEDVEWWLRTAAVSRVSTVAEIGCELRRHPGARLNGTDVAGRLDASHDLLVEHADWFAGHPRAEAFRLARMGLLSLSVGDRANARHLLLASLRRRPSALAARSLLRTIRG